MVLSTVGGTSPPPQLLSGEEVLRGFTAPAVKSAALLSVSVQPPLLRMVAVVLEGAAAGPEPSKQLAFVAKPTKSMIWAPLGQAPLRAVVELTRAALPPVPAMRILPMASGVGSGVVPPAPWAC